MASETDGALLRIGEIAAFFGVSVKAMRIYERKGLIKPARVDDATGYRYYSADQVRMLDALLEFKRLGFSLAEIKKLLGGSADDSCMEALVHKKTAWLKKITEAENKISEIDEIIKRLAGKKPATKLHKLTEDERAELLAGMVCLEGMPPARELSEAIWV